MTRLLTSLFLAAILALPILLAPEAAQAEPSGKLIVFHAGSLSVPFAAIEKNFEAMYPNVDVLRESGGSTKMARMISEVGKPADIMASADYEVIDKTLIPGFASWNIRFASNQMVLCYTEKSKFADEINGDNWTDILGRKGVVWGHSDPNLDPCGYRSLMVLQLAEKFYAKAGLYDALIANRPEKNVRPKSVELISLLQAGHMDYAWEYLSVAVQHGLKYVTLDNHLNLGDFAMTPYYESARVQVTGAKPGTFIERVGKSITYGITKIDKAPNSEAADAFLAYLFAPDGGLKILKDMGQPPFVPVRTDAAGMAKLPESLKPLATVDK
ncbi:MULTISPECIES: tungstate ABC transporter substrate-binding protein WtpA [unclassified Pseudodesulfovibrio]|uniref:tungstate ABC transporter substrate-binding protein WtpA n=1 Tax=unclassified Pseudodesulfovibrio TaxID=2661612 RepID=UPI000FEBE683|nr:MULTISPECIES: tungstate ABC transporter substrate-binding protein WtpA [unclassified Pseudodesulfovibrio]MCJ2165029.1 tungstate ABC transporter substrate-binding protein WtpA [Pseudodesulfovibrio sp. S3-i]RWU03529.1 tungstate ABC transporter substrate-binding protein WtpA [Pseudodesulfovibrio sp. S3]